MIKPVLLYEMETCLPRLEIVLKIERRILRRICGPKKIQEVCREIKDLETEIRIRRLRFDGHMVRMDHGRLNKRVFDRIREYKSVGGYVKQMREETEELKITHKNCPDREHTKTAWMEGDREKN